MRRAALLAGLLLACGDAQSFRGFNLILVNIDTLRPDHLGAYGYARDTSPFIDSLARDGVVFEQALSNSSFTRESVSTLFSGRLPSASGSIGWDATPTADTRTLGERVQAAGYRTGFFSMTTLLTDPAYTRGFDEYQHLTSVWGLSRGSSKVSERALEFVRREPGKPFMLYLHYLDPHGPYEPPPEMVQRFAKEPFANPVGLYLEARPRIERLLKEGFGPGEPRFEDLVLRYDAEIADTDRALAQLFEGLEPLGVLERTLIVVTADHGEEFLEHGFLEHGWTLFQESVRIPLVFWAKGLPPERVAARVSTVDVAPTVLALLEIPHDGPGEGSALFRRVDRRWQVEAPSQPYIGELLIPERNVVRTVIAGDWKYVAAQRWVPPAQRVKAEKRQWLGLEVPAIDVWGPPVREALYNLAQDPHETRNLAEAMPEVRSRLAATLKTYQASVQSHATAAKPPAKRTEKDAERLRALGYLE
jgi:arylsulfatase